MLIAIPEYNGMVSPLLDTAQRFVLGTVGLKRRYCVLTSSPESFLVMHGVDVLICGAGTRYCINRIRHRGIQVIPRVAGRVEDVLGAYMDGTLDDPRYMMPGCRRCCMDVRGERGIQYENRESCMKIAVSAQKSDATCEMDPRFGRAPGFMVFDTSDERWTYLDNTQNYESVQGAGVQAAGHILDMGVSVVITGNIGPKAFRVLAQGGVETYLTEACTVAEALERYRSGTLLKQASANVEGHW